MEKLRFSDEVYEKGAGRIYELLIRISMPALVVGVLVIAVINGGFLTQTAGLPDAVKMLFLILIVIYVVPSLFVFPTAWMLRSWKTRDLRDSYVMAGKKSVEYHKIADKTVKETTENVYIATQIKKVEETDRKYTVIGNILEKNSGVRSTELVIPKAYENMELIKRAARYR